MSEGLDRRRVLLLLLRRRATSLAFTDDVHSVSVTIPVTMVMKLRATSLLRSPVRLLGGSLLVLVASQMGSESPKQRNCGLWRTSSPEGSTSTPKKIWKNSECYCNRTTQRGRFGCVQGNGEALELPCPKDRDTLIENRM